MTAKRIFLEIGTGNDLHGCDYTKAAVRAVEDAIHHSSLALVRTLHVDLDTIAIDVTVGVQRPEEVNRSAIKAALPHGSVNVNVVKGGLDVPEEGASDLTVIATAAIAVCLDLVAAK
ncbi:MAG: Lin0512 family protein [Alphaproteobacteria bacterium]|nr:Lin0512 family protein [Alphaproteobacteria bacterium]MDE2494664.1 Lin0512 family protein [Alphaproteobacteria bacterium]